jgi:hypothetical protein
MDMEFELFKGKSFKDLCKDIYVNQERRKEQIEVFIGDLRPLIKTVNDAMIVAPIIKGYMDAGNQNDDHLVRLAAIIQKIISSHEKAEAEGGSTFLSDQEKKQLMDEVESITKSDSFLSSKLDKE